MEIPVGLKTTQKYHGHLRVEKYKALSHSTSLLLINKEDNYYQIYNILFVAACKVDGIDDQILMGFYLGEHNELECYPLIDELPSDKYFHFSKFDSGKKFIVDYASYQKNCEMIGEPCWKLPEYITHRESPEDRPSLNTLFLQDGKLRPYGTDTI